VAAAGDSVAAVAVAPVESAIAGKRFTPIEQAKGCHESMAPFFFMYRLPSGDVSCDGRCVCGVSCDDWWWRSGEARNERPAKPRSDSWHWVLFAGTLTHHDGEYGQGH
jgi:hypothetical protein